MRFSVTGFASLLISAAVIGSHALAAGEQAPNAHSQPIYGQPAYGYSDNDLRVIIGQLLGDRYNEADRAAVRRCAAAAMQQAAVQYQPQPSGSEHRYGQGYNPSALSRVTSITRVLRRENGLSVSGLIETRFGHPPYGDAHGFLNNGYAPAGELLFNCSVDHSGLVFNLRIHHSSGERP